MKKKLIFRRKKPPGGRSLPDFKELIRNNQLETLRQHICQSTFNINQIITADQSLIQIAYSGNHYRAVKLLLENGANPFLENQNGQSAYKDAIEGPDCKSKQILLQYIEDVKILIKFDQREIIQSRINEGKMVADADAVEYLLKKKAYSVLKQILRDPIASELQKKIYQHCLNTNNIEMYRKIINGTDLENMLLDHLQQTIPWKNSILSEQQIDFLLNLEAFHPCFMDTIEIVDKKLLHQIADKTGQWRGMSFRNPAGQELLKQQHINFFDYLESGYQCGIKITLGDLVNHILINTDSPTAKALYLTGFQLGIMTSCIERIKSLPESNLLEEKISDTSIFHKKSDKKWIKYRFTDINADGVLEFLPLDDAKNTCDRIQFTCLQNFIEKNDNTNYFTNEDTPVTIRENNLNLEQHEFIRRCWQISPLWLKLLQDRLALPCIILSDVSSRQIYDNLLIEIDGRAFKLGDVFPISIIDYDHYVMRVDSGRIEPGMSLLLTCSTNIDALNSIFIPSDRVYHLIDMDFYTHREEDLQRLLSWADESSLLSGRIYSISTGTLCGYFSPELIPDSGKHKWQVEFIDLRIANNKQKNRPDIREIPVSLYSELKALIDPAMEEEDKAAIREFLYLYYQSTGNRKDRENVRTHFTANKFIKQVFLRETAGISLTDIRFPLLLEAMQSSAQNKIITGTGTTKKALSGDSRFKTAVLTTQGERKLLDWEKDGTELFITCWSGRRTIRLLASRRFTGQICLFDAAGSEYTEKLLKLFFRLEIFFLNKNTIALAEFKTAFGKPLAEIYGKYRAEDIEEESEGRDDILLDNKLDKNNLNELKEKYELEKKPGSVLLIFDDSSSLMLRGSAGVFSCDYQREKNPAELEAGETIIAFNLKDEKYADITELLIKTDAIKRIFDRTQGWRKLLQDQIFSNCHAEVFAEVCNKIRRINELTFRNWTDLTHYQIGPRERKTHSGIWKLYSPDISEAVVSTEWQKITEFRIFKLILGNRLGELMNSNQDKNPEKIIHSLFMQIFDYLEISEQESRILFKQVKNIIQTSEKKTISVIIRAD